MSLTRPASQRLIDGAPLFMYRVRAEGVRESSVKTLRELAERRAPKPESFDRYPPVFWRAEISNNSLDAYITKMHTSSLEHYARDAAAGVSFQPSHDIYAPSLGASLTGEYAASGTGRVERVLADFYTAEGIDASIDSFIARMHTGIARDVSIGFYGGGMRCSICNEPAFDFLGWTFTDCEHVPGLEYKRDGGGKELAFLWIDDAHLAEVSSVYDGATPGAEIVGVKATALIDAGQLDREQVRSLNTRFRSQGLHLPEPARIWPGAASRGGKTVDPMTDLRAMLAEHGITDEDALGAVRRILGEHQERTVELGAKRGEVERLTGELATTSERVKDLEPLAEQGRAYREHVVEQALEAGVRAFGQDFAREAYAKDFTAMSLDSIKRMAGDWDRIGNARFKGGRQTVNGEPPPDRVRERAMPIRAYGS